MGEKKKTAHQALYRKYRSKSLDEIVGQIHITKTLAQAVAKGKISHAYLFTGPRGVGKTSIARILAHEINQMPYEDEVTKLDIIEIDAASNRRIDDIRDLRDKVHIAPVSAKYKVYIIDEVHMLTTESFNALLKTLEEPPAHVVFILATTEVHKLPATIVSRTQRHSFRSIPAPEVAKHLKMIAEEEKIDISDEALLMIAEYGEGSFRDSISILDQLSHSDEKVTVETIEASLGVASDTQIQSLLQALKSGSTQDVLQQIEDFINQGFTPASIAEQLVKSLHQQALSGELRTPELTLMKDLLLVQTSGYPKLALETSLLDYCLGRMTKSAPASLIPTPAKHIELTPKVTPKKVKQEPAPIATPKPTEAIAKPEPKKSPVITTPANVADIDINEHWPNILGWVEQRNKPLYTILRLAVPKLDETGVCLTFKFGFHQKRADDSKHKIIVAQAIHEVIGTQLPVQTMVDKDLIEASPGPKTQPNAQNTPPDPAHASLIDGVQAIMGGGEIVHV